MKVVSKILYGIWELPQIVLGILLSWVLHKIILRVLVVEFRGREFKLYVVTKDKDRLFVGGSFSSRLFLDEMYRVIVIRHEIGHSYQSRRWGWLYLLVIGVQSVYNRLRYNKVSKGMNPIEKLEWRRKRRIEREADDLAGITLEDRKKYKLKLKQFVVGQTYVDVTAVKELK